MCWHCRNSKRCDCIACDGRCSACLAWENYREPLVDPRDRNWWVWHPPEAPARGHWVFCGPRKEKAA